MDENEFIEILKIFKKQADRLERSKNLIFKKYKFNLSYKKENGIVKTSLIGINQDDFEVLSVLVRKFWMKNSNIQISKIFNYILNSENKFDNEICKISEKIKNDYKKWLFAGPKFTINKFTVNNREELLSLFFNGDIFHTDKEKISIVNLCEKSEVYLLMRQSFFHTLQCMAGSICFFNNLVVKKILDNYNK